MISVEPLVVQLRFHKDEGQFGDPYIWSATGVRIAPGVLEIIGVIKAPLPSIWR